ncbi:MAG: NrfD/PsrC family molybdoenzyme membrane anchor subunit [Anaerolineae bacterium]
MHWSWPVIVYLWVAGLGAGAYLVTFLADRFSGGHYHGAKRAATATGVLAIMVGLFMLIVDLGHPIRAWHLFARLRPVSPMSIGSWLLFVWSVCAVVLFFYWWLESLAQRKVVGLLRKLVTIALRLRREAALLEWATFFLSILLMCYTGVLLTGTAEPLWSSTVLLPVLFVFSAVATGIAAINLLSALGVQQIELDLAPKLCKAAVAVCLLEILTLAGLLMLAPTTSYAAVAYAAETGQPCAPAVMQSAVQASVVAMVSGSLSFPFWVGVVLVGLVLPLGAELSLLLRGIEAAPRPLVGLLGFMVLLGGFALRAVIVFAGQM